MDESKKNLLVTLEGASGLYEDLRGRILDVESELGAEIDEVKENYASKENLESAIQDVSDDIPTAYVKAASEINNTLTLTLSTDDVVIFNNTTYSAGTGLSLTGTEFTVDSTIATVSALESGLADKADLVNGKVPAEQLPSYVDDVLEYSSLSTFPTTGETGKVYVAKDTNFTYRWSGTQYTKLNDVDLTNYYTKSDVFTKSEVESALASKFDSNSIATYDGSGTVDTDIVTMMNSVKNSLSTNPT